jgi:hypothetical protein
VLHSFYKSPPGRAIFPGGSPLNHRLLSPDDREQWTIVRVAENIRGGDLVSEPQPLIYCCICQAREPYFAPKSSLIRTARDPHAVVRSVEAEVRVLDRDLIGFDVKTMDERVAEELAPARFNLILISICR